MEKIPTDVDELPMFFLWSADEFVPVVAILGVGMFAGFLTGALVVAYVFLKFYRRKRDGNPRDFIKHWGYWAGFVGGAGKNSKSVKSGFARRFIP